MKDAEIVPVLSEEAIAASAKAVHDAKNAAQAIENARALQLAALNENTTRALVDALRQVFGEYSESQRFLDTKRIPLICKQIDNIHDNIQEIKENLDRADKRYVNNDQFWPVKTVVYALVGLILTGVIGALLVLVIRR